MTKYVIDETTLQNIANSIRSANGKTTTYTPGEMSAAITPLYKTGYDQAESDFWDAIQNYGNRESYNRAFRQWNSAYIRPKYKVTPTDAGSAVQTFNGNTGLKRVEAECFDFSQKPYVSNSSGAFYYTFDSCSELEEIEDIGIYDGYFYRTFGYCSKLYTIAKIKVDENTVFTSS